MKVTSGSFQSPAEAQCRTRRWTGQVHTLPQNRGFAVGRILRTLFINSWKEWSCSSMVRHLLYVQKVTGRNPGEVLTLSVVTGLRGAFIDQ